MFGVKVKAHDSWDKQLYVIAFLGTRYLFMTICFAYNEQEGCFDVMFLMAIFLFNSAMFFSKKPLYGKWNIFLGRFNTLSLLVCSYHLIMFSDMVDVDVSYYAGWSLVTVILTFIIVNLLYLTYDTIYAINMLLLFFIGKGIELILRPLWNWFLRQMRRLG